MQGSMCLLSSVSCFIYLVYDSSLNLVTTLIFGFGTGCMPLLFTLISCEASSENQVNSTTLSCHCGSMILYPDIPSNVYPHVKGVVQGVTYALLTIAMSVPRIIK